MPNILGLHHITAICGPAQENVDFYHGVLGLSLVKVTVNFDDPSAYHLYYGDANGTPGTILTFFPYPHGYPGRPGRGQTTLTSLSIPKDAIPFWVDRFKSHEVEFDKPHHRENGQVLGFRAPDGLGLELVATASHTSTAQPARPKIPPDKAIGPVQSVTIMSAQIDPIEKLLVELLGLTKLTEADRRHRFDIGGGASIEVLVDPNAPASRSGHGSVHHIAFRVDSEQEQNRIAESLKAAGFNISAAMDRSYFKSVYFREPGGVLFEVATEAPGFAVDEPPDALGTSLKLPIQFEPLRFKIERMLPSLNLPGSP